MSTVCVISSDLFGGQVCFTVMLPLCEDDGKNSMGPATRFIHVGGSYSSVDLHIQERLENAN